MRDAATDSSDGLGVPLCDLNVGQACVGPWMLSTGLCIDFDCRYLLSGIEPLVQNDEHGDDQDADHKIENHGTVPFGKESGDPWPRMLPVERSITGARTPAAVESVMDAVRVCYGTKGSRTRLRVPAFTGQLYRRPSHD